MEPGRLIHALPTPVIWIGRDDRVAAINPAGAAVFGEGLTGRHYITALRQPSLLSAIERAKSTRTTQTARYLTSDETGHDVTYQASVAVLDEGVLASFEDVTHLDSASQMRRDFVANVSHELRTPLTALLGFIETMLRGPAKDDPVARERFLSIMEAEAGRMNRLVGDLMSLNRVEAEERQRPIDPVALGDLLRSVLHGLTPLAAEAGVVLEAQIPDAALSVPGDADQLRQVATNLVENAIKYGREGERCVVALLGPAFHPRLRCEAMEIVVRDYGPGIDAAHVPRLTERFYRVDTHRSREQGGTGLGLAIVKHIVTRHRGRLQIDSELGQGSRFSVILPVDA
ncbi:ATP-binding protein [Primorskyibacter sp. S187A]|uniref:ATP-binding protein n=1 Tax=Primorskyibacter sp. S187A TaxID=3415130 RepID=UPI003C7E063D